MVPDHLINEANAGRELAEAIDRFYDDLRYTAPEAVGLRLNQLGARITEPMAVFGLPRGASDKTRVMEDQ